MVRLDLQAYQQFGTHFENSGFFSSVITRLATFPVEAVHDLRLTP